MKPTNDVFKVTKRKKFWFSNKTFVEVHSEQDVWVAPKNIFHLVKNPGKRKGKIKSEL